MNNSFFMHTKKHVRTISDKMNILIIYYKKNKLNYIQKCIAIYLFTLCLLNKSNI